jgi:hypothetical protein
MSKPTLVSLIREYQAAKSPGKWTDVARLRANTAENDLRDALAEVPGRAALHDGVLYLSKGYGTLQVIKLPQDAAEIDRQARDGELDTAEPASMRLTSDTRSVE